MNGKIAGPVDITNWLKEIGVSNRRVATANISFDPRRAITLTLEILLTTEEIMRIPDILNINTTTAVYGEEE